MILCKLNAQNLIFVRYWNHGKGKQNKKQKTATRQNCHSEKDKCNQNKRTYCARRNGDNKGVIMSEAERKTIEMMTRELSDWDLIEKEIHELVRGEADLLEVENDIA